jgi:aminoglycoside phosphotransferase (APT) family kinase protein
VTRQEWEVAQQLAEPLASWINDATSLRLDVAATRVTPLAGGHSNVTYVVTDGPTSCLIRRPPQHELDASAHSMSREWTVLTALDGTSVPSVVPYGYCADASVIGAEFLVLEYVADSVSITDALPDAYASSPATLEALASGLVEALASLHAVDWHAAGLDGFGRPEGFLERQVPRWEKQYRRNEVRDIPVFDPLTAWLHANLPDHVELTVMHGDFHLDNCLFDRERPVLRAIVDWEMTTIGDPLMDLGLCTAFWGTRLIDDFAMPKIQGVSRLPGSPDREHLVRRYAEVSGRDVSHVAWYQAFALWKLGVVIEAAWGQHVRGELRTDYTAALEHDVPALFNEAAVIAGLHRGEASS